MNAIEFPTEMKFFENKRIAEGKRAQKTEKWSKHTFLIGVKIGMGTRKWLMFSVGGQAGRKEFGFHEIKNFGTLWSKFGMVQSEPNQQTETKSVE